MMSKVSWQSDLEHARTRWKAGGALPTLTVWDILVERATDSERAAWVVRLRDMDVTVVAYGVDECAVTAVPLTSCVGLSPSVDGNKRPAVVMPDPWDDAALQRLSMSLGFVPDVATSTGHDLAQWRRDVGVSVVHDDASERSFDHQIAPAVDEVIHFVDRALAAAVSQGGSDIHFETDRNGMTVKHRIDGVLRAGERLDSHTRAEEVISRIKVLSRLDITERRIPQDGRFRYEGAGGLSIDLRVSVMPSVHGEDAVLRLLDRAQLRQSDVRTSLDMLQFDEASVSRIRDLAQLPHGMLLVTGPTGSGKTTTVYGILSELNNGTEKIVTIEDPVEYELPGVLQIPVNERKGLTFAKGLRSILRHDPDRILVGEIRDAETAEIAVQSALTGHQVFTTVHANSMFDVTARFRHFGLDMFGFAAALNGVVVQRLVRGVCPRCVGIRPATERETKWLAGQGVEAFDGVPMACGCEQCNGTGYRRRFVLAEVHQIDDVLRDLVTGQHAISALRTHVVESGVMSLASVAAVAVRDKCTTIEEVRRVVGLV